MKRNILLLMMALFPFLLYAQSYDSLWKQVEDAEDKDQPRTEIGVLDKIVAKAQKGKDYGHLLSAELMRASLQVKISPDSLEPEVKRLQVEADLAEKRDPVMAAIFQVALGKVWENTASRHDVENRAKAQMAYEKAEQPKRRFYRVIREGNYTSFPGFYGFLMRNCNTLPLSSNIITMKKFMLAVDELLKEGHFVLVYPEQSMWKGPRCSPLP